MQADSEEKKVKTLRNQERLNWVRCGGGAGEGRGQIKLHKRKEKQMYTPETLKTEDTDYRTGTK